MRFATHNRQTRSARSGFTASHRPTAVRKESVWVRLLRTFKWGVFLMVTFACIFPLMFSFAKTGDELLATGILGCCFSFMLFTRLFKPRHFSYFFGDPDSSWHDQLEKDFDHDEHAKIVSACENNRRL